MSGRHGVRRSESFAVRRWLQLGAASAGVGAGLLGFSLLGPQVGTAAADSAGESSTSSSASTPSDSNAQSASTDAADAAERDAQDAGQDADDQDADDGDADDELDLDVDDEDTDTDTDDTDTDDEDTDGTDIDDEDLDDELAADEPADGGSGIDESTDKATDETEDADAAGPSPQRAIEDVVPEAKSQTQARSLAPRVPSGSWSDVTGRAIENWTSSSQGWINSLPVDSQAKYHLVGALWATRRTFLNRAPSVAPIQISGKIDGPVVGNLGAVDPDGDRLVYVLTKGPRTGSVQLNRDGTYTYTPGADFNGVDTFSVVAIDVGPHINIVDPLRPIGTRAANLVNQGAIKFEFVYITGAEHWTPERRDALNDSADQLVEYFLVKRPVVLTYNVTGLDDEETRMLASAGSDLISDDPGFWPTVVQHKLLTGIDANGSAADGRVNWNFGYDWGLGDDVGPDEYDFTSTAIHELLHSFGFLSYTDEPGENDGTTWATFDRFVVTRDRAHPIDGDYEWDTDYDLYLTGGDGGLYFGGANAVRAFGDLIPLFTPDEWEPGSSGSHLDDDFFTGLDQKVMNAQTGTGLAVRVLSPLEIGILRDLGYRADAPPATVAAMALIGFLFVGRRWRKEALGQR
jgi:hypothetical protein